MRAEVLLSDLVAPACFVAQTVKIAGGHRRAAVGEPEAIGRPMSDGALNIAAHLALLSALTGVIAISLCENGCRREGGGIFVIALFQWWLARKANGALRARSGAVVQWRTGRVATHPLLRMAASVAGEFEA